jgi:membrane protein implicated in regulation of membrane protease activity
MEWLRDNMWEAWLGLAILLGVAEMFSLDLILIMLAVGAIAGMVTAALDANLVKKFHSGPELNLGHGKLVGQQGLVTQAITAQEYGRIKVGGEIWTAAPYDDSITIAPGETVEVFQIRGATAFVHPIPRLEP